MGGLIGVINTILNSSNVAAVPIAGEVTVYTKSFPLHFGEYFGLWCLASSSGTPTLKIELEQSYALPATEGSSDTNWVEPDSMSDLFANLNDKVAHIITISPKPMKYARFKITGLTGNPSDVTISMKMFSQEWFG